MKKNHSMMKLFSLEQRSVRELFLIGLSSILLTGIIGHFSGICNDGVLDIHIRSHSLLFGLSIGFTSWLLMSLFSWIVGTIFSKSKIRIIDVMGMMAYAKTVFLMSALFGFLIPHGPFDSGNALMIVAYILFFLVVLFTIIIAVYLMWKAFSLACNLFKTKGIILFILILILAEAASIGANYLFTNKIEKSNLFAIEQLDLGEN